MESDKQLCRACLQARLVRLLHCLEEMKPKTSFWLRGGPSMTLCAPTSLKQTFWMASFGKQVFMYSVWAKPHERNVHQLAGERIRGLLCTLCIENGSYVPFEPFGE